MAQRVEAAVLGLPEDLLLSRAQRLDAAQVSRELLSYPEIVTLTCPITDPQFGAQVLKPAPKDERYRMFSEAVANKLSRADADDLWDVVNPLWQLLNLEYDWVSTARLRGFEPSDALWNVLRYLE
ncbi:hypothetical protein, partial [uncultured Corynebacterium sp.]|uniref:hypothetical protein n=1 Tax=uncultured Corynebacterium sp. TaxID=159447 RepID=UPI0025D50CF2